MRIAIPRFATVQPGTPELRMWLEQLVSLARARAYAYVYCPTPSGMTKDELFRSVGLVPHADVLWHAMPAPLARMGAAAAILTRQKKRFDIIVAPDFRWAAAMRALRWLHKARVVPRSETTTWEQGWRERVLCPSSS